MNDNTPQTSKSVVLWAWQNAMETLHGQKPSAVLEAIGSAFKEMPDSETTLKAANYMREFSERIAKQDGTCEIGTRCPALSYHLNWSGEWEIRNSDLVTWSYCTMWVGRADVETMAPQIVGSVTKALSIKRLHQAYLRYNVTGLTKEHCSLLAHVSWEMDMQRGDWVSIFVQGKRPFGNSGAYTDIYDHAGWPMDWGDDGPTEDQKERAWNLFDELVFAATDCAALALKTLQTPPPGKPGE